MFIDATARLHHLSRIVWLGVAFSAATCFGAGDERPFAKQADELVTRLDVRAREFKRNAEALDELAFRPEAQSLLVYKTRLNMLKEDVVKMRELVTLLDQNRSAEEDWQVQLLERLLPKLQALTVGLDHASGLLDRSTQPLWAPQYQSAVGDIRDLATGYLRTIDVFRWWAADQEKNQRK